MFDIHLESIDIIQASSTPGGGGIFGRTSTNYTCVQLRRFRTLFRRSTARRSRGKADTDRPCQKLFETNEFEGTNSALDVVHGHKNGHVTRTYTHI